MKLSLWSYFLSFTVFLRENYVRSWIFPALVAFSLWAKKLNQQPVVRYDMGKRNFVTKRNRVNTSACVDTFFVVQLFSFQMSGL